MPSLAVRGGHTPIRSAGMAPTREEVSRTVFQSCTLLAGSARRLFGNDAPTNRTRQPLTELAMASEHVELRFNFKDDVTNYRADNPTTPLDSLGPLGPVNLFVGATNSGKSRLLRALAKCVCYAMMDQPLKNGEWSRVLQAVDQLEKAQFSLTLLFDPNYNPSPILTQSPCKERLKRMLESGGGRSLNSGNRNMPLSAANLQSLTNCVTGAHSGQLPVNNPHYASAMQILFTISMVGFLWETNGGGSRFLL